MIVHYSLAKFFFDFFGLKYFWPDISHMFFICFANFLFSKDQWQYGCGVYRKKYLLPPPPIGVGLKSTYFLKRSFFAPKNFQKCFKSGQCIKVFLYFENKKKY